MGIIVHKDTGVETLDTLPLILALSSTGEANSWLNFQDVCTLYAKDKILWSLGTHAVKLRGGTNKHGEQSILLMDTIVAVDNAASPTRYRSKDPRLSNKTLFERDKHLCAYCGTVYKRYGLTRDHVTPTSKGGKDVWENVVTACIGCNQYKSDRTPEQCDMKLLYVPYVPTHNEHLILQNRRILECQMEFLMTGVSKHSRLHQIN